MKDKSRGEGEKDIQQWEEEKHGKDEKGKGETMEGDAKQWKIKRGERETIDSEEEKKSKVEEKL